MSSIVAKSAGLLDIVCANSTPLTFTRLVELSGMTKSSTHRILSVLVAERLLSFDPDRQTYQPGVRLLGWSSRALSANDLPSVASDIMESLNRNTGAHVCLSVLAGNTVLFIKTVDSIEPYRLAPRVGEYSQIHASAAGKVMLAHLRPAKRDAIVAEMNLERCTENTITSRRAFAKELRDVAKRGIALCDREEFLLVNGISAPVFGHHGEVIAAMSLWDLVERNPINALLRHEEDLRAAARALSARLGAQDGMPDAA
ncbi:MAG: IclR family transcriptional regulator [Pseudomonadota bacterium]